MFLPPCCRDIIVLGAGPAGLAAAIVLAKDYGINVTVYDSCPSPGEGGQDNNTDNKDEEDSFPVSMNPRSISVLKHIDPSLLDDIIAKTSYPNNTSNNGKVSALSIRAEGPKWKEIARLKCGTIVGTTRGIIVSELYNRASQLKEISFCFEHELIDVDIESNKITFRRVRNDNTTLGIMKKDNTEEDNDVVVDFTMTRILDCMGCYSKLRTAVAEIDPTLKVTTYPWDVSYRCLFTSGKKEHQEHQLDKSVHYLFPRRAYVAILHGSRWSFSLMVDQKNNDNEDDESDSSQKFLLETQATPENVQRLKRYVAEHCPPAAMMLDDNEYSRFFKRRSYSGQVVHMGRLHYFESILFLGDSAHCLVPPTGEGINAALEDISVLREAIVDAHAEDGIGRWFEWYDALRIKDAQAISEYAAWCIEGIHAEGNQKKVRTTSMVLTSILRKFRVIGPTWTERSFGELATGKTMMSYSEMLKCWKEQKDMIESWANFFVNLQSKVSRFKQKSVKVGPTEDDKEKKSNIQNDSNLGGEIAPSK